MKYILVGLLFCFAFSKDAMAKKHHKTHHSKPGGSKIVGGHDADIKDYPYQAFLLLTSADPDDHYQCGGSIVTTRFILTAAHCFIDKGIKTVQARVGATDKFFDGVQYNATFYVHENYNQRSKDYDIAYVKTDEEMTLDGVNAKAISLIEEGTVIPSGSMLKLSGWGATGEGEDATQHLMAVDVPSWSNEDCNEREKVTTRQFCGGYKEGGKDTCQGDSGGPCVLSDTGVLAGIVSAGYGCARPNQPGIYTNLSDPTIRSWLSKHTGL